MDNEFIRRGIEADRWLKAERLSDRFVSELRDELERVGTEIVGENSELFPGDVSANWNQRANGGSVIAFARVQYPMRRRAEDTPDADGLLFNLGLRWADPTDYSLSTDGAVCLPRYKIKNASDDDFEAVVSEMGAESDVRSGPDPHRNAPGSFYVPVTDPAAIGEGLDALRAHFGRYGEMFGVPPAAGP